MGGLPVFQSYAARLSDALAATDWGMVEPLAEAMFDAWQARRQVFLCGNGGSAGNANHLANDYLYPVGRPSAPGLRVHALTANPATLTCLANDEGYDQIFAIQLKSLADAGDLLIVLSGSGNSPNVLRALETAREMGVRTFAILGFDGGRAKQMADHALHFPVNDMQVAEDLQMVVGNMVLQYLHGRRGEIA